MKRTAVFISGSGSNLQSIVNRRQAERCAYDLKLVFSNEADAFGLKRAQKADIPTEVLSHRDFDDRESYDRQIDALMQKHNIELIALAGFMRLLSPWFVEKWAGKLINIHPSLLPAFPGLHTHQRALDYGVKFAGCSVFFVDSGVDTGCLISQAVVPILDDDTADILAARVLEREHIIFPQALNDVASGKAILTQQRQEALTSEK